MSQSTWGLTKKRIELSVFLNLFLRFPRKKVKKGPSSSSVPSKQTRSSIHQFVQKQVATKGDQQKTIKGSFSKTTTPSKFGCWVPSVGLASSTVVDSSDSPDEVDPPAKTLVILLFLSIPLFPFGCLLHPSSHPCKTRRVSALAR